MAFTIEFALGRGRSLIRTTARIANSLLLILGNLISAVLASSMLVTSTPIDMSATASKTEDIETDTTFETTEEYVKHYFSDAPVLVRIAWCESRFRHYGEDNSVLRGEITPEDVGVMQINEYFHGDTAREMGLDLEDIEDNLRYARYLYEKKGTQPWSASKSCWGSNNHLARIE